MVLTAPALIEAPAVTPARGGLLAVANVADSISGDRIEMGVNYFSYLCGTVGLFPAWCGTAPGIDYDAVKAFTGGQQTSGWPFVVYAGVECDLFGRDEYGPAARARLAGGEDSAVAKAFLGQQFFGVGQTPVDVNADFTDLPTAVIALGKLEQYAALFYAGLPVIHMNRATATLLSNYLEIALDGTLTTIQGTPVANSAGYPDNFMFVTGAVHAWRSAVTTVSVDNPMANTAMGLAERTYVVTTDCLLAYAGNAPTPVPAPTLTTVAPTTGTTAGGTTLTLTGTGFTAGEITRVLVGGVSVPFTITNATTISATTVAHAAGVVDVVVEGTSGSGTKAGGFTFLAPPGITSLSPDLGSTAGGQVITITGTDLTGSTGVTFGGTAGTAFSVTNATTAVVTTPAKAAGAVTVVLNNPRGNASLTNGFTYATPMTVTSLDPTTGPLSGEIFVTVNGTGLADARIQKVTFGGVNAVGYSFGGGDTNFQVQPPPHAAGVVDVVIVGEPGTANVTVTNGFTYVA